jgi:hypothetical protein
VRLTLDKEQIMEKFEQNVAYLQRNIPPDDIYAFSEQTFMACIYFLGKFSALADIEKECERDPMFFRWVRNILGFQKLKDDNQDIDLDLDLNMDGPSNDQE